MQTLKLGITTALLAGATACSHSGGTTIGVRSDGLTVECEQQFDDVSTCTPDDGDDHCESWANGGAANVLWPPNHKLIRFTLDTCAAIQDGCDGGGDGGGSGSGSDDGGVILLARTLSAAPADAHITSITSDEPVEVGRGGDGHTTNYDVAIIDARTFDLRSERQGGGDGRVYRVNFVDSAGVTGSCEFLVPHNQGPTSGALDSGTAVTVTP